MLVLSANASSEGRPVALDNYVFAFSAILYHSAGGTWPATPETSSPFNVVVPTGLILRYPVLQGQSQIILLDNGKGQVLTYNASEAYGFTTYQISSNLQADTTIVQTFQFGSLTINIIDNFLAIPPDYSWAAENVRGVDQFQSLAAVAKVQNLGLYQGFTAFVPLSKGNFFQEAQNRYPAEHDLVNLFNNHVRHCPPTIATLPSPQ